MRGVPQDVNVVKKHPVYLSGQLQARNMETIDTRKVKALAKKHGATLNDVMLTVSQMTFQKYFEVKGDKSKFMTWAVPISFYGIPERPSDYTYGNKFAGMVIYTDLEKEFNKAITMAKEVTTNQLKKMAGSFYAGVII